MKRTRRHGDSSDLPRKRHAANAKSVVNSSWEDADSDSDAGDADGGVDAELRQHEENLNAFIENVQLLLDESRNSVMANVTAGRITVAAVNVGLKAIGRELMAAAARPLQSIRPPSVPETAYDITTAAADNAIVARMLDAQEARLDALYERVGRELGFPLQPHRASDDGLIAPSPPPPQSSAIVDNSLSPRRTVAASPSANTSEIDRSPQEGPSDELPMFLTALKPKYSYYGHKSNWCYGCNTFASLVPTRWSESFHRTLHQLRSAVPPPSAFAGHAQATRTMTAGRPAAYYGVLRIDQARYNDGPVRRVREYVDAELGVSESGIRRYERFAYLSVVLRGRDGAATAVIGYLEAEPVTATAHPLGADGRLLPDDRRPVKYGVSRVWVSIGYRRRRIGTSMLDAFRADHTLRCSEIAFAAHEIMHGDTFVRHYIAAAASRDQESDTILIYTHSSAWYK